METLPLSLSQLDIWTEHLAWPDSSHLNIGGFSKLLGEVDLTTLERALNVLVQQNDTLRLVVNELGHQVCLEQVSAQFEFVDFSAELEPEAVAKQWQKNQMARLFDNKSAPPIRFSLLRISTTCHYITLQSSHLIMDGWSVSDAVRKWANIYDVLIQGKAMEQNDARSYASFIDDSRKYKESKAFSRDEEYWREELAEIPERLFDRKYQLGTESKVSSAHLETCLVPKVLLSDFQSILKTYDCTLLHGFVAILASYLAKAYDKTEIVIGLPTLNRSGGKYKSTLGMFVGVIPITVKVDLGLSVLDIAQQISKKLAQSYRHAKYPLSQHFKRLKLVEKNRDRLFDVMFSYESFSFDCSFGDADIVETRQTFSGLTRYPLAISLGEFLRSDDAEMVLEGKQEYFSSRDTKLVGERLISMLEQVLTSPQVTIFELSLISKHESRLLDVTKQPAPVMDVKQSIFTNIFEQAALNMDNVAAIWQDQTMTYQELLAAANHLARQLESEGVGSGDIVAFSLEKGPEILVSILAIVQIGAAFLPVDLNIPEQRFRLVAKAAECKLLITNKGNLRLTSAEVTSLPIELEQLLQVTIEPEQLEPNFDLKLSSLAYVIFTSGTSGTPKGVTISHEAITHRLQWLVEHWGITHKDRSLQATQSHFDPALIELLLPLTKSGTVVFPEANRSLPEDWPRLVEQYSATLIAFVPSTLRRFIDGIQNYSMESLRVCCCGGEVLEYDVAKSFTNATGAELFNVYGPTEATIFASAWKVDTRQKDWFSLPVGTPLSHTQVFILDPQNNHLPYGVIGQIYLGGRTLSDGYLAASSEANNNFISIPQVSSSMLYKTGDFGWIDLDGTLHFSERRDRQIKLRGYRIELSEIEAALNKNPNVKAAAVKLHGTKEKAQIHAWLELVNTKLSVDYRRLVSQALPDYMVPSKYYTVPVMPYTTTGKVAYSLLEEGDLLTDNIDKREPIGAIEKDLLLIWRDVLKNNDLSVLDNFFESGGDSLSAVIMLTKVEAHFSVRLPLHVLVDNSSLASFAESIERELCLPTVLLSLGQTSRNVSLFIAASGNGDVIRFKALAKAMEGTCDLHMLQPPGNEFATNIDQLAELYSEKIARLNEDKVYLAGFSVGGLAALETARKLQHKGVKVEELFIVDTILVKMPKLGILLWQLLITLNNKAPSITKLILSARGRSVISDVGLFMQVKAMRTHRIRDYDGNTSLLKSSIYYRVQNILIGQWRKIIKGKLREYKIEASHSRFFEPGKVDKLAEILIRRINSKK